MGGVRKMAEYIERDEILQKISRMIEYCKKDYKVNGLTALFQVGDAVIDCKSADVVPVAYAQWEEVVTHNGCTPDYNCVCSNCKESGLPTYKYCPSCGSVMR